MIDRPRAVLIASIVGLAIIASACGTGQSAEEHGQELFGQYCADCHLNPPTDLRKMPPKLENLFASKTLPSGAPATDEQVRDTILHGLRTMPPFERNLKEDEVTDLIKYLHTLH